MERKQPVKEAKHKNQASSTRVFLFFKEVVFIPQLKSLLWQIAHFTVEPEETHRQTKGKSSSYTGIQQI